MTRRIDARVLGVVLTAALCLAACGSGSSGNELGGGVLTSAVAQVTFRSDGGGFHGIPPTGAACDPAKWAYVTTMATHDVTWTGCTVSGMGTVPGDYTPVTVDHPLDVTQWFPVQAALADVSRSDSTTCGADKDSWSLTLQTTNDAVTYGDDFYACAHEYAAYVTSGSLQNLYSALEELP